MNLETLKCLMCVKLLDVDFQQLALFQQLDDGEEVENLIAQTLRIRRHLIHLGSSKLRGLHRHLGNFGRLLCQLGQKVLINRQHCRPHPAG